MPSWGEGRWRREEADGDTDGVKVEEFMNSCEASVRGFVNPGETRCSSDGGEERRKMHSQGFFHW